MCALFFFRSNNKKLKLKEKKKKTEFIFIHLISSIPNLLGKERYILIKTIDCFDGTCIRNFDMTVMVIHILKYFW